MECNCLTNATSRVRFFSFSISCWLGISNGGAQKVKRRRRRRQNKQKRNKTHVDTRCTRRQQRGRCKENGGPNNTKKTFSPCFFLLLLLVAGEYVNRNRWQARVLKIMASIDRSQKKNYKKKHKQIALSILFCFHPHPHHHRHHHPPVVFDRVLFSR